jgi:hypothetical protein
MLATKGPLWKFFHGGEKQNTSHYKAYCLGCVSHHALNSIPRNANGDPDVQKVKNEQWFIDGEILAITEEPHSDSP